MVVTGCSLCYIPTRFLVPVERTPLFAHLKDIFVRTGEIDITRLFANPLVVLYVVQVVPSTLERLPEFSKPPIPSVVPNHLFPFASKAIELTQLCGEEVLMV